MKQYVKNAVAKYKNMPAPVKASGAYVICSILQKGIQLITTPIFTRIMSTEQYGEVSLFSSWLSIVTIFASFKVAAGGFNAGMERYSKDRDSYISSLQGLSIVSAIIELGIFSIIYIVFIKGEVNSDSVFIPLAFIYVLFATPVDLWLGKQRYDYKYKQAVIITLFIVIADPLLGLLLVNNSYSKGLSRIISIVLVQVFIGAIAIFLNHSRGKRFYDKTYWKYILTFNIPLIPHYLAQMVLTQSDRIMIERICGKTDLAIYGVAYTVGMIMLFVLDSINASYVPWTYKRMKESNFESIRKHTNSIVLFVGLIVLIPVIFAPEIMYLLGGEEYNKGIWVVPSVSLASFFIFIYGLFGNIQFYYGESKKVVIGSCIAAISNLILNYIFIRPFGFIAAGYTTAASYLLLVFFHYNYMKKVLKKNNVYEEVYNKRIIFVFCLVEVFISAIATISYMFIIFRYSMICGLIILLVINKARIKELLNLNKR